MSGKVQNTPVRVATFSMDWKLQNIICLHCLHYFQFYSKNIPLQLRYRNFFDFIKTANFKNSHRRCSVKKVFVKISQNWQKNTCARDYFLLKLQAKTVSSKVFPPTKFKSKIVLLPPSHWTLKIWFYTPPFFVVSPFDL